MQDEFKIPDPVSKMERKIERSTRTSEDKRKRKQKRKKLNRPKNLKELRKLAETLGMSPEEMMEQKLEE